MIYLGPILIGRIQHSYPDAYYSFHGGKSIMKLVILTSLLNKFPAKIALSQFSGNGIEIQS